MREVEFILLGAEFDVWDSKKRTFFKLVMHLSTCASNTATHKQRPCTCGAFGINKRRLQKEGLCMHLSGWPVKYYNIPHVE